MTPSLARRMACFVYEAFMLFGLGLIPGLIGTAVMAIAGRTDPEVAEAAVRVFAFGFYGLYFVWFWVRRGQTLPMQTWHIRLLTRRGSLLRPAHAVARYFACWVWVAPPALVGSILHWAPASTLVAVGAWIVVYAALSRLHPEGQFWHDALCGTRLVMQSWRNKA